MADNGLHRTFNTDIAIIGGGASGLAAAVSAAKKSKSKKNIIVIEKENKVGRKLLATGNGRCNLSNKNLNSSFYNGSCAALAMRIIKKFSAARLMSYLDSLGIMCKIDDCGRIYPQSEQASAVLDMLKINMERYGVAELCDSRAEKIEPASDGFKIYLPDKIVFAKKVILTTGGCATPNLGSDGSTYELARLLNLRCSPVFPSLAPIKVKSTHLPALKGVRTSACVSLVADGAVLHRERGELQFTQDALSGICIFQLSRLVNEFFATHKIGGHSIKEIYISVDLMPDRTSEEVKNMLLKRRKQLPFITLADFLTGVLNKKIGGRLFEQLNIKPLTKQAAELKNDELDRLADLIKDWRFTPSHMSDFSSSQVTAGGIVSSEIDGELKSVRYKNLYIAGEALDVDGLCGGYNLHWAFVSGIIAGSGAAAE